MTKQASRFIGSIPEHYDRFLGPRIFHDFATGLVFGNPLFEEVSSRGGDPGQIRSAVANAIDDKLGISMPLQALIIEARKD